MVEQSIAKERAVAIRGVIEAALQKDGWHPKRASSTAEEFARQIEGILARNGHGDPGAK